MDTLLQDLRYAVRSLLRTPGFTLVAALTLALGIGANTAIFSVVDAVLLKPLPYPESDRLVQMGWSWSENSYVDALSAVKFVFWREHARSFDEVAAYQGASLNVPGPSGTERVTGQRVSAGIFRVLGIRPALGRGFLPEEDVPGGPRVAVMGDALARRLFGSAPRAVGRQLRLNGESYTVVGVLPADFRFEGDPQVWLPRGASAVPPDAGHNDAVLGRLKPGVSREQARADLDAVAAAFRREYPELGEGRPTLQSYHQALVGDARGSVLVLFGSVGFVLLIACANVANLLLGRAAARRQELAVRAAIGASRGRILRQLLTESVTLAVLGGAAGLLLAEWCLDALLALSPGRLPGLNTVGLDLRVLAFTVLVSVLTGVVFGVAGSLQAIRPELARSLGSAGRTTAVTPGRLQPRDLLVSGEAALSMVLLVGAGLLIVSFFQLRAVRLGFDPAGLYTAQVSLSPKRYGTAAATGDFSRRVLERLRALPGVESAAVASSLPLTRGLNIPIAVGGARDRGHMVVEYRAVTPEYFRALRVAVRGGRVFGDGDRAGAPPVAVVNEAMAKLGWPDGSPLDGEVSIGAGTGSKHGETPRRVVGVVADVRDIAPGVPATPTVYVPQAQVPDALAADLNDYFPAALLVRTAGPADLGSAIRRAVAAVDPEQPVTTLRPMEEVVGLSLAQRRFQVVLLGAFAGLALLLTAVGLYGVISYSVRQRTREIGVRVALGARRTDVLGMVLRRGMLLTGLGLAAGVAAAVGLTRFLAGTLYGVSATDPATYAGVALLLGAVALLACWLPARRATRVDPMVALRTE